MDKPVDMVDVAILAERESRMHHQRAMSRLFRSVSVIAYVFSAWRNTPRKVGLFLHGSRFLYPTRRRRSADTGDMS